MLNALFRLQLGVDLCRSGSCVYDSNVSSAATQVPCAIDSCHYPEGTNVPAAAAGSVFFAGSALGLRGSRLRGLRARVDSDCRDEGDRERRSKRDGRRTSGSV